MATRPQLFRVVLPVTDIDFAAAFYGELLGFPGKRVSDGRHYFRCGTTTLLCYDALSAGDHDPPAPNSDHVYYYFSTDNLEAAHARAVQAGCTNLTEIKTREWGERAFYARDPFGNPISFVDAATLVTTD
jgi:predicted enzyme related to lactoylglutathione lyase